MRNLMFGVLCGMLLFAGLSWWTARQSVHAAVLTSPPAGRFELVQLHDSAASGWSGILDTETGCVWAYSYMEPSSPSSNESQAYKWYKQFLGSHTFSTVSYDASAYVKPAVGETDYLSPAASELGRIATLCNKVRVHALEVAAPR